MLLVMRHRAVRLAALLALLILVLAVAQGAERPPTTLFAVGGCLAAVAGARLLAPGAALAAARRAAGPWWLAPAGRLAGAMLLLGPVLAVAAAALAARGGDPGSLMALAVVALLQAAALGALTLALAPPLGASAAGLAGLVAALLGGLRPSEVHMLFDGWPHVQRVAVSLWNVLPLSWRALRWLREGAGFDLLMLGGWIVVGVALAAGAVARADLDGGQE